MQEKKRTVTTQRLDQGKIMGKEKKRKQRSLKMGWCGFWVRWMRF